MVNKFMTNNRKLLYLLALLKFVIPFFLQNAIYEPHRDELLYLHEAHHMAWGFMEVPPLLSVLAWLGHFFGNGMFWIKCWPSLFGAFTYILTGEIIMSLGGSAFALFLDWLPFIFGAYLRVHFLFQPNFLEIFFWTLMAYSLIRAVQADRTAAQTSQNKWLYLFGLSVGLGMLSKYSAAFFTLSLLAGLALTSGRKIFRNRHLYFSLLLALLIFLPNLIWQAAHHFPVVYHMKELQKTQLQYISPASFLIDQIIFNSPCLFIWVAGLWRVSFGRAAKEYRFLGWAWLILIVMMLIEHGKSYYTLGAYPVLFAFGAFGLERLVTRRPKAAVSVVRKFIYVLIPLGFAYWLIPIAMPIFAPAELAAFYEKRHIAKLGVLRWEDLKDHPLPMDFADMLGWKEMTQKAAAAYSTLDSAEKKHLLVFCDNYGEAGALNYYGKQYGLPEAYSDNASFLYWLPDSASLENILLVTDDHEEMSHPFIKDFVSVTLVDSVTNPFARERGSLILLLKRPNDSFIRMFSEKIAKDKAKTAPK
jgi:hypothetical protein